jgi:hypothetical protein
VGYCRGDDEWLDLLELVLHDVSSEGCAAAASTETAILTTTSRLDGKAGDGWRAKRAFGPVGQGLKGRCNWISGDADWRHNAP